MTGGKIENLVDSFSADTSLFIANALYFNEKWEIPFLSKDTVTGEKLREVFRTSDNRFVNAPFIEQKSSANVRNTVHLHLASDCVHNIIDL